MSINLGADKEKTESDYNTINNWYEGAKQPSSGL
jgi:hypothetical protein